MRRSVRQRAASFAGGVDPWLTLAFLGLMCVGVLMVYSSSIAEAYTYYGTPYYFLIRELIWVSAGLIALIVAAYVSYQRWERIAFPFFLGSLVLLALVMVPHFGHSSHGAQRWIALSSQIAIEPSELAKLALAVYLAAWLASKRERVRNFKACFVPFSAMVGIIAIFILKQPDLGTAIVVVLMSVSILYVAGANIAHLGWVGIGASGFAYLLMHNASYRQGRLTAFVNPWNDPTGVGYHTIQALLALRYGGVLGQGLGNSTQKYYLPAPHTDSILAVIGEELGLVGSIGVLLFFIIVAYRGMRIVTNVSDPFGKLLAAGITSWITFQALLNFAVITSSVPFTGVPLPFISYGGTSLVITMTAMGILLNISRHASERGFSRENIDQRRGDRRSRVPRVIHHPVPSALSSRPSIESGAARAGGEPTAVRRAATRTRRPRPVP